MKKTFVLVVLFALPIVAYLFFSSGVNNFAKLPVVTQNIASVDSFKTLDGTPVSFKDHITILSFFGNEPSQMQGNMFNVNEKIYKRYSEFQDFQFVVVLPEGNQEEAKEILDKLEQYGDTKKWRFAFGTSAQINNLFQSLQTNLKLNSDLATPFAFIIDKDVNLRGRDDEEKPIHYGYDTASVGEISDKFNDDIKVILAEYRLALKKYKADRKN
ncbi:hypothetical protein GCM10009117_06170 [Gangjinia marincola]|uniref:Uncharacterized protein n=1 Tax=Gangjinia marincola TaxID=578463 RepID=A0ABN1MF22_9FLAO